MLDMQVLRHTNCMETCTVARNQLSESVIMLFAQIFPGELEDIVSTFTGLQVHLRIVAA